MRADRVFLEKENRQNSGSEDRRLGAKLMVDRGEGPPESKRKEAKTMEWPVILAIVLGIPVIFFPAAYVAYLDIGGIVAAVREKRKATRPVEGLATTR